MISDNSGNGTLAAIIVGIPLTLATMIYIIKEDPPLANVTVALLGAVVGGIIGANAGEKEGAIVGFILGFVVTIIFRLTFF